VKVAKIVFELELPQQKRQRRAHILRAFHTRLLEQVLLREEGVDELPIGAENFARGDLIFPSHAAGLAQEKLAVLGVLAAIPGIGFGERHLKGLRVVVPVLYAFEHTRDFRVGGARFRETGDPRSSYHRGAGDNASDHGGGICHPARTRFHLDGHENLPSV